MLPKIKIQYFNKIKTLKFPKKINVLDGRNDWTRTSDLFVPNEAFYQAELHSDLFRKTYLSHFLYNTSKILKKIKKDFNLSYTISQHHLLRIIYQ